MSFRPKLQMKFADPAFRALPVLFLCLVACCGYCQTLTFVSNPYRNEGIIVGDISADGSVVVGTLTYSSTQTRAYLWKQGEGVTTIGDANGRAYGVSADGSEVAMGMGTPANGLYQPYRWTAATNSYEYLGSVGGGFGTAFVISSDGNEIWGSANNASGGRVLFQWTESSGIQAVAGNPSTPWDVYGSVETGIFAFNGDWNNAYYGFKYTGDNGFELLATLGGPTYVYGVSPDGSAIVGQAHSGQSTNRPVFWNGTGLHILPTPNGNGSAMDASNGGNIIVGRASSRAARWTAGSIDFLDETYSYLVPQDWTLQKAAAISPDGRYITGTATKGSEGKVFVLDTVPEPEPLVAFATILTLFFLRVLPRSSRTFENWKHQSNCSVRQASRWKLN